jgi:hypothetical protein
MITVAIARQVPDSSLFNTINFPTVEIRFQRSPGKGQDVRGIAALDFQVESAGTIIQTGQTGKDGLIKMMIPGGAAQLQFLHKGQIVARYDVTIDADALDAIDKAKGQQQRLRMLGYQQRHAGDFKDGVTGLKAAPTGRSKTVAPDEIRTDPEDVGFERSVLDFQVDVELTPGNSSIPDPLRTQAGS